MLARRAPALMFVLLLSLAGPLAAPARAGPDVCPEPNNSLASACFLGPGAPVAGFLDSPDDVDGYRIELPPGSMVVASLTALPADYSLRLLLPDGSVKAEAVQPGLGNKTIQADGLPPGTYYLAVLSQRGESSASAPYSISVSYPASIVLSSPAAPGGAPRGSVAYVPAPASAYGLQPPDITGSYSQLVLEQSEDGRSFHQMIAAPDVTLLKVAEFPDGIPYSSSKIAVVDAQVYILPYGSNEVVTSRYDELLTTLRSKYNVQPALGWGSEQVYSYASIAVDKPRIFDRGIALKHRNAVAFIEMIGLEQFATWDAVSGLMRAVEGRILSSVQ